MKTRFIIGSTQWEGVAHTHWYIFDQELKETLFYPSITPNGKVKSITVLQNELKNYCDILNKQNEAGEFTVTTATLTKKEADYIANKIGSRLKLVETLLASSYEDKKHSHNITSFQEEIDTINRIFKALSPVRFPLSVLKNTLTAENRKEQQ